MPDHIHMLLLLPATLSLADVMHLIKGGSSKWVNETFPEYRHFEWQKKYGAFHVSESLLDTTINYIKGQEPHHKELTFKEEFLYLLKQHRIEYDERYLWE